MPSKKELIYEHLRALVTLENFPDGRLPNEKELAASLSVSQGTLRTALARLERENRIERIRSRGTFIKSPTTPAQACRVLCVTHLSTDIANPLIYIQPGMEYEANRQGCEIVTVSCDQIERMTPESFGDAFGNGRFEGVVLCLNQNTFKSNPLWRRLPLPTVAIHMPNDCLDAANVGCVQLNFQECWRMAMEHLLKQGHRRIACLAGPSSIHSIRDMRLEEYFRLLQVNGADADPGLLARCEYDRALIVSAVNELMDRRNPPTALLCISDFYAMHAYEALKLRGYSIPGDVAVMGNCGYPGGQFFEPPLSTVDYGFFDGGVNAVKLVLQAGEWFGQDAAAPRLMISGKLLARTSTCLNRSVEAGGLADAQAYNFAR